MHKLKHIYFVFILFASSLSGITTEYNIKALGLKVAYISISQTETQILVKTHSLMTSMLFPSIDNVYMIDIDNQYRPVQYTRKVKQKNLLDEVRVDYNYTLLDATMHRQSDNSKSTYRVRGDSRDVFSFISYLASRTTTQRQFNIDANGCPWQATVSNPKREEIKTKIGKLNTNKYEISFKPLSNQDTPYIDMVTHNFVNTESKLELWVSDSKIPVKAVVRKKAITMSWELIGLKP